MVIARRVRHNLYLSVGKAIGVSRDPGRVEGRSSLPARPVDQSDNIDASAPSDHVELYAIDQRVVGDRSSVSGPPPQ